MAAKEEWRFCAEWLVRCKILAPDHKVTWQNAEVFDLAQTLRDGVLICHLLNSLAPGAIDLKDFSQRPQMSQFLCLKNIRTFLTTCKAVFGMKESDLFDPYDLFDVRDFGKVISTLSKLSKSPLAIKSGIAGYPPENAHVKDTTEKDYDTLCDLIDGFPPEQRTPRRIDDEDIYKDLEFRASKIDLDEEIIYGFVDRADEEDDIYWRVVSDKKRRERRGSKVAVPQTKRDYCIKELVETEKNYIEALRMIIDDFMKPLKHVLPECDRQIIFKGIEELHHVHSGFHSQLQQACSAPSPSRGSRTAVTIPDCFIRWKAKFLIYGDFCSNLPKAQNHVDEVSKRNPIIQQQIKDAQERANEGRFRLRDLLSVPMQRVLKYHLLLKELIKQTDRGHDERENLERALEAMQDLSLYVNEVKRDNETLTLIEEIQASIVDLQMPENTALNDYGRLLKDGELKVKSHEDHRGKMRYIFLFDKVILMCKSRGESYSYKHALILNQYKVDEANNLRAKRDDKWNHQFILVERQNQSAYTFCAKTDDMRRKWIEAIRMALDNTQPEGATSQTYEFAMHSFDVPTECSVCNKLLRGVFYQGYKCKKTNIAVHKECIAKAQNGILYPRQATNGSPVPPHVKPRPGPPISNRSSIGKCKATYSYNGMPSPGDRPFISFKAGDAFDLLSRDNEYWWEGRFNGREGFFPSTYVRLRLMRLERYDEPDVQNHHHHQVPAPVVPERPDRRPVYKNINDLNAFPWFVGELDRDQATRRLERFISGAYLVRESVNVQRKGEYALSMKFGNSVKHMKINRKAGSDSMFYLADCKMFRSVPELVEYYQENTLKHNFPEMDTTLLIGYKDAARKMEADGATGDVFLGYCYANYDYAATAPNQLTLRKGDRIQILSKAGGDRGWWKGELNGKIGYFPNTYVSEEDDENVF